MTDTAPTPGQSLNWYPTAHSCPRCSQPIKARGTPTFSKIFELLCTKCGWRLNIEQIRTSTKATITPIVTETEDFPDDD